MTFLLAWVTQMIVAVSILMEWNLSVQLWIIALGATTIANMLMTLNHIFFPEAVLLSYTQIHRAVHIYKIMDKNRMAIPLEGLDKATLLNYVKDASQYMESIG
jgi:hypothetical protein